MADTSDSKETSFAPGEKMPILGINLKNANGSVRWGLPIIAGLGGVLILWFLS